MNQEADTLAVRVRAARLTKRWTQSKLAREAGVTRGIIEKIEQGRSKRPWHLPQIARALGMSLASLDPEHPAADDVESTLDAEALMVATVWSRLEEPYKSAFRDFLLQTSPPRA